MRLAVGVTTTPGSLAVLTGAPGAGKSTLMTPLLDLGRNLTVMDIDEILDEEGHLLGVPIATPAGAPHQPAYNELWAKILQMSLRAGQRVLFCCPMQPEELSIPARWAMLDCSDAERQRRLRGRGWDEDRVTEALQDAAELRARIATRFDEEAQDLDRLARRVADWAEGLDETADL